MVSGIRKKILRNGVKIVNCAISKINGGGGQGTFCSILPSWDAGFKREDFTSVSTDYIRYSSLELAAHEIIERDLPGSVAELGVYEGKFAQCINRFFPNRTLYLFDTFNGFDERDILFESNMNYSSARVKDWNNPRIDLVLDKMRSPDKCVIKKGYFPETAEGINDNYVFVSIDVDLFEPTYQGLLYFYPRLTSGGYIFVHDYNYVHFRGVRAAVKKFVTEFSVPYFPLSDACGTVVLLKS